MSDQDLHCLLIECSIKIWREKIKIPPNTPKLARPTDNFYVCSFGLKESYLISTSYPIMADGFMFPEAISGHEQLSSNYEMDMPLLSV